MSEHKVSGEVTISIGELDSLREAIKTKQNIIDTKNKEIESVKARQKEVKVTVSIDARDLSVINTANTNYGNSRWQIENDYQRSRGDYGMGNLDVLSNGSRILGDHLIEYTTQHINQVSEKLKRGELVGDPIYIGFDDVYDKLRIKAEVAVQEDLDAYRAEVSKVNTKLRDQKNLDEQDKLNIEARYNKIVLDQKSVIKGLEDTIKELKGQEVEKTKDKKIDDLLHEIELLKNRSWWKVLFNIK